MERTPVPAMHQEREDGITEPQLNYIQKLLTGKDLSKLSPVQRAWLDDADLSTLTKSQASRVIKTLWACNWAPRDSGQGSDDLPEVLDGRYAIPKEDGTLMFYSVKKGKYTTFVNVWASDARYPIKARPEKIRILTAIQNDPDAGPRFGREIGACYVCGRTLTDELSRSLGIGPVCRDRV